MADTERRIMIAGNWKMNASRSGARELASGILAGLSETPARDVVICPPFPYLSDVADALGGDARIGLGAQDMNINESGAFTGEVAGPMLRDVGCSHVILGHSERRTIYGETDADVAMKTAAAFHHGLTPIICVGETLEEREAERTERVIERQLRAVMAEVGAGALANSVIAYEPVWAIGTGKTATPEMAQAVHRFARSIISGEDAAVGAGIQILYGGSMKGSNAAGLLSEADIDGGLIGGAALKPDTFLEIIDA